MCQWLFTISRFKENSISGEDARGWERRNSLVRQFFCKSLWRKKNALWMLWTGSIDGWKSEFIFLLNMRSSHNRIASSTRPTCTDIAFVCTPIQILNYLHCYKIFEHRSTLLPVAKTENLLNKKHVYIAALVMLYILYSSTEYHPFYCPFFFISQCLFAYKCLFYLLFLSQPLWHIGFKCDLWSNQLTN